jgi:hypothetical protein
MFKRIVAAWRRRKLKASMRTLDQHGFYVCKIRVVAGTHYLVRHDGLMYKVGKPK